MRLLRFYFPYLNGWVGLDFSWRGSKSCNAQGITMNQCLNICLIWAKSHQQINTKSNLQDQLVITTHYFNQNRSFKSIIEIYSQDFSFTSPKRDFKIPLMKLNWQIKDGVIKIGLHGTDFPRNQPNQMEN